MAHVVRPSVTHARKLNFRQSLCAGAAPSNTTLEITPLPSQNSTSQSAVLFRRCFPCGVAFRRALQVNCSREPMHSPNTIFKYPSFRGFPPFGKPPDGKPHLLRFLVLAGAAANAKSLLMGLFLRGKTAHEDEFKETAHQGWETSA